jgi:hypothetical protein
MKTVIAISPMMTNGLERREDPARNRDDKPDGEDRAEDCPDDPAHVPSMRPAFLAGDSRAARGGPWGRMTCLAGTAPGHRRSQPRSAPGTW